MVAGILLQLCARGITTKRQILPEVVGHVHKHGLGGFVVSIPSAIMHGPQIQHHLKNKTTMGGHRAVNQTLRFGDRDLGHMNIGPHTFCGGTVGINLG